jgi:hypothetical protein
VLDAMASRPSTTPIVSSPDRADGAGLDHAGGVSSDAA